MQGSCTMYTDVDGNGRADMTAVDALTNTARTWLNVCGENGGDDPNTLTTRDYVEAPPIDDNLKAMMAAGWPSRIDDVAEIPGGALDKLSVQEQRELAGRLSFAAGTCDEFQKYQVYAGLLQMWQIQESAYRTLVDRQSWVERAWSEAFWGRIPADAQQRVEVVLAGFAGNWGRTSQDWQPARLHARCHDSCPAGIHGGYLTEGGSDDQTLNFCGGYFSTPHLVETVFTSQSSLEGYVNLGFVWFGTLLHHRLVAPEPNRIVDVAMRWSQGNPEGSRGAAAAKALARAQDSGLA